MRRRLATLLESALDRHPAAVRSTAGERLEPAAIRAAAARIAGALRDRGLTPDEPVLITIGNRPSDLAAFHGAWLAGAVAVPIDAPLPNLNTPQALAAAELH
jgi:acyl-CoA synthetase (AMP-forming)/AMP-acid ligase II